MLRKQIHNHNLKPMLRYSGAFIVILSLVLVGSIVLSNKASADVVNDAPGCSAASPGTFLGGYNALGYCTQNGDQPFLRLNSGVDGGAGTIGDPFRLQQGVTLDLSVGYQSNSPTFANDYAYTWVQVPDNKNLIAP